MSFVSYGLLATGLLFSACISAGPGPATEGNPTIPPIDAQAPKVFKTATFSMG